MSLSNSHEFERVKLLSSGLSGSLLINLILGCIVFFAFSSVVSQQLLIIWIVCLALVVSLRYFFLKVRLNADYLDHSGLERWLLLYRLGVLLTAIVWGSAGFTFLPENDFPHQVLMTFLIGGLCAGAIISLSVDRISAFLFLLPIMVPHLIGFFLLGNKMAIGMGLMLTVFLTFVMIISMHQGKSLHENFRLRIKAVEEEARIRNILDFSPVAASIIDMETNELLFANQSYVYLMGTVSELNSVSTENQYVQNSDEYQRILSCLKKGEQVTNVLLEIKPPSEEESKWVLASFIQTEYLDRTGILSWFYDISDRKKMEEKIAYLAYHDPLTCLPNRALFNDRLKLSIEKAHRDHSILALMFIDLDGFKAINDNFGHHVGDSVLEMAAMRMSELLRKSDSVSRLGGDEFGILLPEISHENDALTLAEKVRFALMQPYFISGQDLHLSSSIGVAIYPKHGITPGQLLQHADSAMYLAKNSGKNKVQLYFSELKESQ